MTFKEALDTVANSREAARNSTTTASKEARRLAKLAREATRKAKETGQAVDHKAADDANAAAAEAHVAASRLFDPGTDEHRGHAEEGAAYAKRSWLHAAEHEGRLPQPEAEAVEGEEGETEAEEQAEAANASAPDAAMRGGPGDDAPGDFMEKALKAAEQADDLGTEESQKQAAAAYAQAQAAALLRGDYAAAEKCRVEVLRHAAKARVAVPRGPRPALARHRANEQAASDDGFTFMANDEGYAPNTDSGLTRVQLAPYGDFPHGGGLQRFTREDAKAIVNEWEGLNKVANPAKWMGIPWYVGHPDHPAFKDRYKDGRAVGRVKQLEAGNDGLYGLVKFNQIGKELVNTEQFHGHSVNWRVRQDGGVWRPFSLKSVGFTNEPNIPVQPVLKANEGEEQAETAPAPEAGDDVAELAGRAAQAYEDGENPAAWVGDEDVWEKAKAAADKTYDREDEAYWPSVVTIYKNMGGTIANEQGRDEKGRFASGGGQGLHGQTLNKGDKVKFHTPNPGEENDRFSVVEDRDDRVLVRDDSKQWDGKLIRPQTVHLKKDLARHEEEATANEVTLSDLRAQLQKLASADERFAKGPSDPGGLGPVGPVVVDMVAPDAGEESWQAVVQCADGECYALGFVLEDGKPVLDAGEPQCVERRASYVPVEGEEANEQARDEKGRFASGGGGDDLHKKLKQDGLNLHARLVKNTEHVHKTASDEEIQRQIDQEHEMFGGDKPTVAQRRDEARSLHSKLKAQGAEGFAEEHARTNRPNYANEISAAATAAGGQKPETGKDDEVKLNQLATIIGLPEAANEETIAARLAMVFCNEDVQAWCNANPEGINQYTKVGGKTFAEHRDAAWKATDKAVEAQRNGDIEGAMLAHSDAANKHMDAHLQARNENVDTKDVKLAKRHFDAVNDHRKAYQKYKALYDAKVSANETAITDRLTRVFGQPEVVAFANANPGDALPPWTAELEGWKTKFSDLEKKHAAATKELGNCMESLKGTVKATGVANEAQLTTCGAMRQAAEAALANEQAERKALANGIVEAALKRGVIVVADKAKLEEDLANSFGETVLSLIARDPALRTQSMVGAAGVRASNAAAASGGDRVAMMVNTISAEEKAMANEGCKPDYDAAVKRAKAKNPALWETASKGADDKE